jgi:hypothetical protein
MKKIALALCVLLLTPTTHPAQDQDPQGGEYAVSTFSKLLHSEKDAEALVLQLKVYARLSPWKRETVFAVAHRLAVNGFAVDDIILTLQRCGDAVAALDGHDEEFADITLLMMKVRGERPTGLYLTILEGRDIPALQLMADELKISKTKLRSIIRQNALTPKDVFNTLMVAFKDNYEGLAVGLAKSRRQKERED